MPSLASLGMQFIFSFHSSSLPHSEAAKHASKSQICTAGGFGGFSSFGGMDDGDEPEMLFGGGGGRHVDPSKSVPFPSNEVLFRLLEVPLQPVDEPLTKV